MPRTAADNPNARRIQSIEVGFRLIRVLEAAEGYLSLKELAAGAGMPASKAYLYLTSFIREGVVQQDAASGRYGLGSFAVQLGLSAIRQLDVVTLAAEELHQLRTAAASAVHLAIWGNRGPTVVSKLDAPRQSPLAIRIGYVLPMLRSATGRVFLTFLPRSETEAVLEAERRESNGGQDHELELAKATAVIQARGYAVTPAGVAANVSAASAPVFDYSSRMVAALTTLGWTQAAPGPSRQEAVKALLAAASRLSAKIGAPPRISQVADSAR